MKGVLVVLAVLVGVSLAGRAFPMESEIFVTELFQGINPSIEWDPTNYLVDLSGQYSLCKTAFHSGSIDVTQKTLDGAIVGGLTDYTEGLDMDAESVAAYIKDHMPRWVSDERFAGQIRYAQKFGCSVQPGCKGYVAIACLFSPRYTGRPVQPTVEPPPELQDPTAHPNAQAFTKYQYGVTEGITGNGWDRSNELENLSGYETDCAMITTSYWTYPIAKTMGKQRGLNVEGFSGYAENRGKTQPAMEEVLLDLTRKGTFAKFATKQLGCSLIPDCKYLGKMYVVVTCLVDV